MTPPFLSPSPAGADLASVLRSLADRVDGMGPVADLPDGCLVDLVLDAVAVSGRVDALVAVAVGGFDAKTVWRGDGAKSCGGWLGARSELSVARAAGITSSGRDLRACPQLEAAWLGGVIGTAKARLLLDARQAWPDRFTADEADLIERIAPLTVAQAAKVTGLWAQLAAAARDADAAEQAGSDPDDQPEADPAASNRLHLSQTLDGRWALDGDLDAVTGTETNNLLDAWIDTQFTTGTYRPDDGLTRSQRRAHALAALLALSA